jgi:hypothetical protein
MMEKPAEFNRMLLQFVEKFNIAVTPLKSLELANS